MAVSGHDLRLVKELLWDVVSSCLKPAERDEVRRALGWELIAKNETLFVEAAALADIMGDVQLTTAAHLERHRLCSTPQRNMAEAEVRMLMERLRDLGGSASVQGSAGRGKDPSSIIPRAEQAVSNFLAAGVGDLLPLQGIDSRPRTPPTRPASAASPNRPGTASSTTSSRDSSCSDPRAVVKLVHGKLNVYDIDAIRGQLQQALQDEHAALQDDLEYLQSLVDGELDFQAKAEKPAASAEDLAEYSKELHKALQKVEHEVRLSQIFSTADGRQERQGSAVAAHGAAADEELGRTGRLRGALQASRVAMPMASSTGGAAGTVSQELTTLSPKSVPRPLGTSLAASSSRASSTAEGLAASLAPVKGPRTSSGAAATAASERPAASGQQLRSPGSNSPRPRPDSGENRSSGQMEALLSSRPSLGSPQLLSPARLQPLTDASTASTASPSASARAAGGASGGGAKPFAASLPPKPLPLGQRAVTSSTGLEGQERERVSSGSSRGSPSVLGRPPETIGTGSEASSSSCSSDGRRQAHPFASSGIPSQIKAIAKSPVSLGKSGNGPQRAYGVAVHTPTAPAATLTSINLVAALDAEVDAVKGGVAAILAKHNYRPGSAGSRPASATVAKG